MLRVLDAALSGGKGWHKGADQDEAEHARASLQSRAIQLRAQLSVKGVAVNPPPAVADVLADVEMLARHVRELEGMLANPSNVKAAKLTLTERVMLAKAAQLPEDAKAQPAQAQPTQARRETLTEKALRARAHLGLD
jgi:hypothetical protein